jgi:hypothetical protein
VQRALDVRKDVRPGKALDQRAAVIEGAQLGEAIQFELDRDDCRVTLLVTAEALELRLPTVEWPTPYAPTASTRLWKRALWSRLGNDVALRALVDAAFEKRRREFVACRYCRRPTPPEHRHGRVCHGCAETHLGIVH